MYVQTYHIKPCAICQYLSHVCAKNHDTINLSMQLVIVAGALLCYYFYMLLMCYNVLSCLNLLGLADISEATCVLKMLIKTFPSVQWTPIIECARRWIMNPVRRKLVKHLGRSYFSYGSKNDPDTRLLGLLCWEILLLLFQRLEKLNVQ